MDSLLSHCVLWRWQRLVVLKAPTQLLVVRPPIECAGDIPTNRSSSSDLDFVISEQKMNHAGSGVSPPQSYPLAVSTWLKPLSTTLSLFWLCNCCRNNREDIVNTQHLSSLQNTPRYPTDCGILSCHATYRYWRFASPGLHLIGWTSSLPCIQEISSLETYSRPISRCIDRLVAIR